MTTTDSRPIIEVEDLSKSYGFLPVLRQVNWQVRRGDFVALLGANGSGKSTLLRMIAGLSKPSSGIIRVGGWEMPREADSVRAQIGMVSHKSLLYPTLTGAENLTFFAQLYGLTLDSAQVSALLARVGLKKAGLRLVRTYSRGMLQRLSIARALLANPHVLLFDEPHTGLDQEASRVLNELLLNAHADGHTIIMTSHDLASVVQLAKRIVIIAKGTIAYDEPNEGLSALALAQQYAITTGEAVSR